MQEEKLYTIDLTKVKGNGKINCPKCGVEISPDDMTEEKYTILEPVVNKDCLEKIVLQCNKCGSKISLVGFNTLSQQPSVQD
jgi:hypothetical protein